MAKPIIPASPGYFILAARKGDGGAFQIDGRTPVIAWRVDAADVEFDKREDAEAIGISKCSDCCPQVVIGPSKEESQGHKQILSSRAEGIFG